MIQRSAPFILRENVWGVLWTREVEGQTYVAAVELADDPVERVKREWIALTNLEGR